MGRSRDIAKFLSSTEAENTNNNALLHTGSSVGVDSAQVQNIGVASYDTLDSLPISNLVAGQQAFVKNARRLYVSNGSGWFNTAVANATPQWDAGGEPDTEYTIADSATPLVITARAIDSDNSNKNLLNQSFSADSAQYMVDISNDSSIFTFTPKSADSIGQEVAAGNLADSNGDFTYTFKWSDGINFVSKAVNIIYNTVAVAAAKVLNSKYTAFLLQTDATSSNAQVDASSNNHTITQVGNVYSTSVTPYHPKGYSTYFDGNGDYLTVPSSSDFAYGTGDFTWELWIYVPTALANHYLLDHGQNGGLLSIANNQIRYYNTTTGTGSDLYTTGGTISYNTWHHVAVVRSSGTTTMYIDGVSSSSASDSHNYSAQTVYIGQYGGNDYRYAGYIRDFRIVKGTAVYTSNFTPTTESLTAITNTSLLTCHSPYIADGSTNNHSITVSGNTTTEVFGPYEHASYTKSGHGGSVYFDGTDDFLEGPAVDLMGSGAFTVECWVNILSNGTSYTDAFLAQYETNNKFILGVKSNVVRVWMSGTEVRVGTTNINNNGWHHIALVRDGSNSCQLYVDGTAEGAAFTNSTDFSTSLENFEIGSWDNGNGSDLHGYISDLRVVKGTAVYTSAFTPPTEPLTAITNTSLLTCTNKHEVWDKAGRRLILNANAAASATQTKYASSSVALDGTNDGLLVPATGILSQNRILLNDFTVEFWAYPTSWTNNTTFLSLGYAGNYCPFVVYVDGNYTDIRFYASSNGTTWNQQQNQATGITKWTNSWKHFAMTYDHSTTTAKLWLDGTLKVSLAVDGWESGASSTYWTFATDELSQAGFAGYIEDVRISAGLARYTANFTPPSESLQG